MRRALTVGGSALLRTVAPEAPGFGRLPAAATATTAQAGAVPGAALQRGFTSQSDGQGVCPHHDAAHAYLDSHRAHDTPAYRVAPDGRVQAGQSRSGVRQQLWAAQHRATAGPAGPSTHELHDLCARFGVADKEEFVRAVHKLPMQRQHALFHHAGGVADLLQGMGIGAELVGRMLQHCPALFSFPARERAEVLMSELMGPAVGKSAHAAAELFVRCPALANTRHVMPSVVRVVADHHGDD